jgi:hypothetical protein
MKKKGLLLMLFIIILGLSFIGCSDSGATTGVLNGYTWITINGGSPIQAKYVNVTVTGPVTYNTESNSSGIYSITKAKPGTYMITVDYSDTEDILLGDMVINPGKISYNGIDYDGIPYGTSSKMMDFMHVEVTAANTTSVDFTLNLIR